MDIGVGAFVLANGLVSPAPAGRARAGRLRTALRSAGPLLLLGLGRVASIKATSCAAHLTSPAAAPARCY